MAQKYPRLPALPLLLAIAIACRQVSPAEDSPAAAPRDSAARSASTASGDSLAQLFGQAWRVTGAPDQPPSGSIYIFMHNGTLLEASCVETYRIATWTRDQQAPRVLHVVEDQRPAFAASITELTASKLRLEQRFTRSHEIRKITLTAVTNEFLCPDLPK